MMEATMKVKKEAVRQDLTLVRRYLGGEASAYMSKRKTGDKPHQRDVHFRVHPETKEMAKTVAHVLGLIEGRDGPLTETEYLERALAVGWIWGFSLRKYLPGMPDEEANRLVNKGVSPEELLWMVWHGFNKVSPEWLEWQRA